MTGKPCNTKGSELLPYAFTSSCIRNNLYISLARATQQRSVGPQLGAVILAGSMHRLPLRSGAVRACTRGGQWLQRRPLAGGPAAAAPILLRLHVEYCEVRRAHQSVYCVRLGRGLRSVLTSYCMRGCLPCCVLGCCRSETICRAWRHCARGWSGGSAVRWHCAGTRRQCWPTIRSRHGG